MPLERAVFVFILTFYIKSIRFTQNMKESFILTRSELIQLTIDFQMLGTGTVNHIMAGSLQSLEFILCEVEDKGGVDI
jgi:hypothetical protein